MPDGTVLLGRYKLRGVLGRGGMAVVHDGCDDRLDLPVAIKMLHRDIKPGNILYTATGDGYKLADFGIAKTGVAAQTFTGHIVGTLAYLSPEDTRVHQLRSLTICMRSASRVTNDMDGPPAGGNGKKGGNGTSHGKGPKKK